MATERYCTPTDAGNKLLAEVVAAEANLVFTRVMVGSGQPTVNPATLSELINPVAKATMTDPVREENTVSFTVEYRTDMNGGLKSAFELREFGVWARKAGDEQSEVLLLYGCLGDYPQHVEPFDGTHVDSRRFPINLTINNAPNVTVNFSTDAFVTSKEVTKYIDKATTPNFDKINQSIEDLKPLIAANVPAITSIDGIMPLTDTKRGNVTLWDVLHRVTMSVPPGNPTNSQWNALGIFIRYFVELTIKNQPTQYGQLINLPANKESESCQLWLEQDSGRMYHRGGNGTDILNDKPFKRFLDEDDRTTIGITAGNLSNPNSWWVQLGGTLSLIIQGINHAANGASWPIKFPNACLTATCSINTNTWAYNIYAQDVMLSWSDVGITIADDRSAHRGNTWMNVIGVGF